MYRKKKFQKYDYGEAENQRRYNSRYPPVYNLSRVPTQNLFLASGSKDALANIADVERLKMELLPGYIHLFKSIYAHLDFILGYNCKHEVYDHVMAFFSE